MRRSAFWAAAGAALIVIVATEAAAARGIGNNDSDGHLRQQLHNPSYIAPSPYAYLRNDPGAHYEAHRRGYPIYGEWSWKYR